VRHAARTDANQASIVAALRQAGARVWIIGLPVDLLVGYQGRLMLMECKVPKKGKHTALQAQFFSEWAGMPISTVDGPEAAVRHLEVMA